jgi:RNA polymerase sigma-70 factor, ECF subfamily
MASSPSRAHGLNRVPGPAGTDLAMTASINSLCGDQDGPWIQPAGPVTEGGGTFDRSFASFEGLVREHSPFLLRLARSLAPTLGVDPEDVVQDTLERAWRSRDSYRGDSSIRAWLSSILTNRIRDLARTHLRLIDRSWRLYGAELACHSLGENTEEMILRAEDEDELRRALTALPFWERTAVLLHDCARLPAWEVAGVLGCSTEAAHKRIQRGRMRLAAELGRPGRRSSLPRAAPRSCRETRRMLSSYLDGTLPEPDRNRLEGHIARCPHCPALVQAMWALLAVLAGGEDDGVREEVLADFRSRAGILGQESGDDTSASPSDGGGDG